jgi:hypothetical protein
VTLNALAAILGGAQSLHTAAYDEALALPTERSVKLALRTQQVLAHEAGLTEVIDPLAGSYYVEALTTQIETRARALMAEIERRGGVIAAIESGWTQQQIADASYERQRQVEAGERVIVGVNRFVEEEPPHVDIHRHLEAVAAEQAAALKALREERDARQVARALDGLWAVAAGDDNVMPALVEAKAYATMGDLRTAPSYSRVSGRAGIERDRMETLPREGEAGEAGWPWARLARSEQAIVTPNGPAHPGRRSPKPTPTSRTRMDGIGGAGPQDGRLRAPVTGQRAHDFAEQPPRGGGAVLDGRRESPELQLPVAGDEGVPAVPRQGNQAECLADDGEHSDVNLLRPEPAVLVARG